MKDGARSPGWNADYSSPNPDHARRQAADQPHAFQHPQMGWRCHLCRRGPDHEIHDAPGLAPATGPGARQPDMVSREGVLREALREAINVLQLARGKLPYGPRFDHAAERIDAALIMARDALSPAPPESEQ